jgi:hypothetical protein
MISFDWLDVLILTMLTGSMPSEIALLTSLCHYNISGSRGLSGSIPVDLCFVQISLLHDFIDVWIIPHAIWILIAVMFFCGCDCPFCQRLSQE